MVMKIEIISRETIKPSSPTPHHLRIYKLSLLDQVAPLIYAPIVLFYSAPPEFNSNMIHCITIYDHLKKTLSETLSHFYPLAGRIKHDDYVDCNDDGVTYVKARANFEVSKIIRNPEMNLLQQFLPFNPYDVRSDKEHTTMAVQVNVFDCGGIGIGVCISHRIADGTTLASFLSAWAAMSRGAAETITPSLDSATLFPPRDIHSSMPTGLISMQNIVTRRFVFDANSMANLREIASNGLSMDYPSRVEAVTALICRSAVNATTKKSGKTIPSAAISHVVNLRARMIPPLAEHTFGNIWQLTVAPEPEGEVELHDIVVQLQKAKTKIDDVYARQLQGDDRLFLARESQK
uniref:Putative vinorine synthase n=1 Tax=Davidia involucrata TaxID=16924 RepID=A0A5B7BXQ8_DAVIN